MAKKIVFIEEDSITLEEAMKQFITFKEAQKLAPMTMRDYHMYLNDFLAFSNNSLDEKTLTEDTLNYLASLPDTSPARYNHPFSCMNAFFNWAENQDLIRRNPIRQNGLKKKRDDGNVKPANLSDVKALMDSWDKRTFAGLRNYTIILLMLDTGIRTSELVQLLDEDFDPVASQITIRKTVSKTRRVRVCYLSAQTVAGLKKLIKAKPQGWAPWIFPTCEGRQLRTQGLAWEFNKQCQRVGVKFTPYQLRHTFASYFVANGGDLFTLQDLMGHSDLRMTRRYTELDDTNKRIQHEANTPLNALKGAKRCMKI